MDFVKETLEWVNRERLAHGLRTLDELPKGERSHCTQCPIAEALPGDVEVSSYDVFRPEVGDDGGWNNGHLFELPECAQQFIRAFDAGELPEYDA